MKYLFILILLTFYHLNAGAKDCSLNLYSKILIPETFSLNSLNTAIKTTSCTDETTNQFIQAISNYRGVIKSKYLLQTISLKEKITVSPSEFEIIEITTLIKEELYPQQNISITDLKLFLNSNTISIEPFQTISLHCPNCSTYGEKNIEVRLTNKKTGFKKSHWINATIKTTVQALVALRHIPVGTKEIALNDFVFKPILTSNPTSFFTAKNQLQHYQLNKPLIKGTPLKVSDLSAVFLVQPGNLTELIFNNGPIKLEGRAYPRMRARYGDTVKLTHPKSGKIISGKVIGKNKVLVEI